MLVKCPSCGAKIRISTIEFKIRDKLVRYLCQGCEQIVMLDLVSDIIPSSSSSTPTEIQRSSRVLVVDDTQSFVSIVEDILTRDGFVVISARDGMDALKKIVDERPDLIVLDLFMPNMSGFEVLKTLRTNPGYKHFRNIPVLVTSGVYKQAEVEIVHDLGAKGFISKDAVPEFLTYRIRKILSASTVEGAVNT
jgi:predicted Zn finger-like uncharacterized protein